MSTYDKIAALPLTIDGYEFEPHEYNGANGFNRLSTVIRLRGGGTDGVGEDVTYEGLDHIALQDAGAAHDLAGEHTIEGFSKLLDSLDLFPSAPEREVSRLYRRWAFESAGLDLALRQAETSLHELLGRTPEPVNFVVSMRLGSDEEPSSIDPLKARLAVHPDLRFKLDPTNDWTDELIAQLKETGAVDSLDLKGCYKGTVVEVETDPVLYAKVIETFPEAWLEDPDIDDETRPILEPVADRVTWDAPIHSIADIENRRWKPKVVNIKPSRFGPLSNLFSAYDYCDAEGIGAYGGGQWELSVGRGHIQYLASIFHPSTPNDVAPAGYNDPEQATRPGLPDSPLEPKLEPVGFRWAE